MHTYAFLRTWIKPGLNYTTCTWQLARSNHSEAYVILHMYVLSFKPPFVLINTSEFVPVSSCSEQSCGRWMITICLRLSENRPSWLVWWGKLSLCDNKIQQNSHKTKLKCDRMKDFSHRNVKWTEMNLLHWQETLI